MLECQPYKMDEFGKIVNQSHYELNLHPTRVQGSQPVNDPFAELLIHFALWPALASILEPNNISYSISNTLHVFHLGLYTVPTANFAKMGRLPFLTNKPKK